MARRTCCRSHIVATRDPALSWPETRFGKVIFGRKLGSQPRRSHSQDKKKEKLLPGKAEPVTGDSHAHSENPTRSCEVLSAPNIAFPFYQINFLGRFGAARHGQDLFRT